MTKSKALRRIKLDRLYNMNTVIVLLTALVGSAIIIWGFSSGISGNDYYWHVKTGEWIVTHRTVPTTDVFSWIGVQKGLEWIPHEWLSDVILYLTYYIGGHIGVFVLILVMALVFYGLMIYRAKRVLYINYAVSMMFLLLLAIVMNSFFYPRPHVFSFFLLYIELSLLYRYLGNPESKGVYLLPLIAVLWSNLHGGYALLSYVLCFLVLLCTLLPFASKWFAVPLLNKCQKLRLAVVGLFCILAVMVNPLGVKALLYPYMNQSDQLMIRVIAEWQSPDAKEIVQLVLFFLPMFMSIIGYIITPRKKSLIDFVLFSFFAFLFLRSIRFIFLWYIFMPFGCLQYLPNIKIKEIKTMWERTVTGVVMLGTIAAIIAASISCVSLCRKGDVISTELSPQMTKYVVEDAPEFIFNDYNYGGELIFNGVPVFFDARADLFAEDSVMHDGLTLMYFNSIGENEESIQPTDVLKKYPFDRILIQKDRALYSYLLTVPQSYRLLNDDEESAYFEVL